jgi:phosphoenolpyruvate---glycerone phosphotransferase subunit DhaL
MSEFSVSKAVAWIKAASAALEKEETRLSDLDAAIGDGDHGANMRRGFVAVVKKLDAAESADLGALYKTVGMTLLSTVGGASGPLYGGFFLELGKRSMGRPAWDAAAMVDALKGGLADIQKRGKAELGDKTMVDALSPALDAMAGAGGDLAAATKAAAAAARDAATKTAPLLARKGRASYLGERSIGHEDPGANSLALLLETLSTTCEA